MDSGGDYFGPQCGIIFCLSFFAKILGIFFLNSDTGGQFGRWSGGEMFLILGEEVKDQLGSSVDCDTMGCRGLKAPKHNLLLATLPTRGEHRRIVKRKTSRIIEGGWEGGDWGGGGGVFLGLGLRVSGGEVGKRWIWLELIGVRGGLQSGESWGLVKGEGALSGFVGRNWALRSVRWIKGGLELGEGVGVIGRVGTGVVRAVGGCACEVGVRCRAGERLCGAL
ncbi:hypothetical protein Tco_0300553 [Tanacetum coccineum]